MDSITLGFIGTLIGTIVGVSASIITTVINNKNAIRIQDKIEKNNREERFSQFQRDNFFQLQEKLTYAMRLIAKAYVEDLKNFKETNNWISSNLTPDLNNEIADCFREISILIERIGDEKLRIEIALFRRKMTECLIAQSFESANEEMAELTRMFDEKMPKLGTALRNNYN
jgi:gas vesicle protein